MELVEKNHLKINYPKGFYLVKQIIDELDPVDLLDMGAPEDEHDFLTADVLKILIDDRLEEVKQLLINAYSDYGFGVEKYASNSPHHAVMLRAVVYYSYCCLNTRQASGSIGEHGSNLSKTSGSFGSVS
jgi:hypothetical protein